MLEHLQDLLTTDRYSSMRITGFSCDKRARSLDVQYIDKETEEVKSCDLADHVRALQRLFGMVGRTLFVGGVKSPHELLDLCQWDTEVTDAYQQLVVYDEVLYG